MTATELTRPPRTPASALRIGTGMALLSARRSVPPDRWQRR